LRNINLNKIQVINIDINYRSNLKNVLENNLFNYLGNNIFFLFLVSKYFGMMYIAFNIATQKA